jgi:hypothetical protein
MKIVDDEYRLIYEEFKSSDIYKNFKFNKSELNKFKIDLTFMDMVNKQESNNSDSIKFAKNNLNLFPEIKPILFVLKRYLQKKALNSAFNGINNIFYLIYLNFLIYTFIYFYLYI